MNRSIRALFNANVRAAINWSFMHFSSYGKNRGQNSGKVNLERDPKPEDFKLFDSRMDKAERKRARIRERNLRLVSLGGMR